MDRALEQAIDTAIRLRADRKSRSGALKRAASMYDIDFDVLARSVRRRERLAKQYRQVEAAQPRPQPRRWVRYPPDLRARATNRALALRLHPLTRDSAAMIAANELEIEAQVVERWLADAEGDEIRHAMARRGPARSAHPLTERTFSDRDEAIGTFTEWDEVGYHVEIRAVGGGWLERRWIVASYAWDWSRSVPGD